MKIMNKPNKMIVLNLKRYIIDDPDESQHNVILTNDTDKSTRFAFQLSNSLNYNAIVVLSGTLTSVDNWKNAGVPLFVNEVNKVLDLVTINRRLESLERSYNVLLVVDQLPLDVMESSVLTSLYKSVRFSITVMKPHQMSNRKMASYPPLLDKYRWWLCPSWKMDIYPFTCYGWTNNVKHDKIVFERALISSDPSSILLSNDLGLFVKVTKETERLKLTKEMVEIQKSIYQ